MAWQDRYGWTEVAIPADISASDGAEVVAGVANSTYYDSSYSWYCR